MDHTHDLRFHFDGMCTIIFDEKKNKKPVELYGHFTVYKCVHCPLMKGKAK